jgi:hypothetical protein
MKKVLLGMALILSLFSCTTSDDAMSTSQKGDKYSFEFNGHTEIPILNATGKGGNTNYTIVVEAFVDGDHKIETKTFASNITAHFNYKFETSYAGNVEFKVTVSPATTIVKNISFISTNEKTKEVGKIIEFEQLPVSGTLNAVYDKTTKEVSSSTSGVVYREVDKDFGDKLSVIKTENSCDGKTETHYRTFAYDNLGRLISSFGFESGSEPKRENSVLVYEGDKVVKMINNEKSIKVHKYENNNIVESENREEQYHDAFCYNEAGKVREVTSNVLNQKVSKSYDYSTVGSIIVTTKTEDQLSKIVYVLNDNINPMAKTVPTPFLKTLSTDEKNNYNVMSQHTFGYHGEPVNDPNAKIFIYVKDAKGRVVKQTVTGKEEVQGEIVVSTRVTTFQYMAQ